jgi:hypothetical protein
MVPLRIYSMKCAFQLIVIAKLQKWNQDSISGKVENSVDLKKWVGEKGRNTTTSSGER